MLSEVRTDAGVALRQISLARRHGTTNLRAGSGTLADMTSNVESFLPPMTDGFGIPR
jgi:hypothetical protein